MRYHVDFSIQNQYVILGRNVEMRVQGYLNRRNEKKEEEKEKDKKVKKK